MNELMEKYARVILTSCLKVKENQPLFVSANLERVDFVRVVANVAYEIGVKDIYFDLSDAYLKHDLLKNLSLEELKNNQYFNKQMWNEYASKGAAFLMLASETPGLMKDIDQKKLSDIAVYSLATKKGFEDSRDRGLTPWCIAAVPTESWAKEVFPNSSSPLNDLWNKIFEICSIDKDDPIGIWDQKTKELDSRSKKLTEYQFKTLKYKNSLGTDFEIGMLKNHRWESGRELLTNGDDYLANYPTLEVFTSPDNRTANGIVYASKPLSYQGNMINNFWIKFENGVAVDCGAEEGLETLQELIKSCPNSNRLGEVALVEYDSEISKTNLIFYETLFDENAACHLALGASFPECMENGRNMSEEERDANGLNNCHNHVDFMIGNKDLSIIGITEDNREVVIFENGNFSREFK